MHRLRLLAPLLLVSCASAADAAAPAGAREGYYPDRPIRLVIPVSVGGGTDIVGRVIAGKLTQVLQQPVVVDNRSGAGGVIGTDMVAKAAPDGYTLLFAYASHTIIPFLGAPVPYDPSRDFAAVAQVTSQPLVLTVTPSLPVSSVKELIALARAKPGQIRAGGPGLGGTGHIAAEILRLEAGIDMPVIVYKGGGPAQLGLMQGEVHLIFATSAAAMSQIKNGRVKVLATSSPQRLPYLPDVPTFAESGLPGIRVSPWQGILAPARTPRSVIDRLHRAVATLLTQPDAVERLTTNGSDIALSSPQELDAKIVKELEYFSRIIRAANIKAE
jgi:tripartite-type tricarboxylate transporter receptor subunit TctC